MSEHSTDFIPCMLIPLQHHYLLLPNTTLAEVIPMPNLEHVSNKPQYWVGQCYWHSWQIPVIDLEGLVQDHPASTDDANKLCVVRGINDSSSISVYGLPCYGVPQLIHLTESALNPIEDAIDSTYLHSQIQIGNNIAYIPNLDNIEAALN
ncbi:MAG: chemotaxis protein CheW [Gammaproteobacteria bacterium]|nr:chemotaxis protein CheW [Gammaproteobacteria bacterium]